MSVNGFQEFTKLYRSELFRSEKNASFSKVVLCRGPGPRRCSRTAWRRTVRPVWPSVGGEGLEGPALPVSRVAAEVAADVHEPPDEEPAHRQELEEAQQVEPPHKPDFYLGRHFNFSYISCSF